jgi:DEAD/DEAH box helicase domain-containing protein
VATIALMCEPHDIGRALADQGAAGEGSASRFWPTLFLFDHVPGGVGLAERMFERAEELLEAARRMIATCDCATGCPACVGPTESEGARKKVALELLALLVQTGAHMAG